MLTVSYNEGRVSSFAISGGDCQLLLGALFSMRETDLMHMNEWTRDIISILLKKHEESVMGEPTEIVSSKYEDDSHVAF